MGLCLSGHRKAGGDVTVMAPGFAQNLFLLSPALHWAVLINTNDWYGCEELKSRRYGRVLIVTNFVTRIRRRRADVQPSFSHQPLGTTLHTLQRTPVSPGFREISKS